MFNKSRFSNLEPSRLRKLMWLFFIAMAVPTAVLVYKSYDQLKWEAFYQHRQLAEELASRIDRKFVDFVELEESRSFSDYSFIVVEGNQAANYLERSPLSQFPIVNDTAGLVGYFQIDVDGKFTSPLLPKSPELANRYGLNESDLIERRSAASLVEGILGSNQLVEVRAAQESSLTLDEVLEREDISADSIESDDVNMESFGSSVSTPNVLNQSQAAFDKLSDIKTAETSKESSSNGKDSVLGRLKELESKAPYKQKIDQRRLESTAKSKRQPTKGLSKKAEIESKQKGRNRKTIIERSLVERYSRQRDLEEASPRAIKIFESEVDPFEISLLESGHFVLYRKVWRDGQRYIQGLLIEQTPFIDSLVSETYNDSLLAPMSTLTLIYQGNMLASLDSSRSSYLRKSRGQFDGSLLYRTRLTEPFTQLESVFTIRTLPAGPGGKVILWAALILGTVLSIGVFLLYRMSLKNLALVNQQQNFVSAVSHELKTPLTSIRMYGEILQEGWADEEKKKGYYSYIFDESERLTRLINNVLELARMTRNETHVDLKTISVAELVDIIHSKVDSQIERSEFRLNLDVDEKLSSVKLRIDSDVFAQIIINLVDNALKFSSNAENKVIDISATHLSNNKVRFSVRDYGPGIAKDQLKKIFELFYRSEDELTRETTGTGIGLALVSQLTQLMNGEIDVVNREIGAEFQLFFAPQIS